MFMKSGRIQYMENHPVAFLMDDLHTGYTDFTQDVTHLCLG